MLAIIGGSGLYSLGEDFSLEEQAPRRTPYGDTSADVLQGRWQSIPVVFLPRHGPGHRVPPHRVNYRANIWALKQVGVSRIISVNAVGGITDEMKPGTLVVPNQLVDYSSGREQTFFDGEDAQVMHVDFSWPYSAELRGVLTEVGLQKGQPLVVSGTYGSTNGPRLETAAEINRMRNEGCNVVGMTGMPEAALARELEIEYACLALVVNWAAGVEDEPISMRDIMVNMEQGMRQVKSLLLDAARLVQQ
ncbi:MAG: S-methyl-5'-thioinosine phosphorylase [Gammaproteobacteria bacterium]|nr:S-methyl-5'-thioinosine phosphorylase [Gammaproteobacteria bacterium]MDH3857611.1 S-methyl-5'-thioinosine phosphorylase [Gammaproteobacteria bacterium]